MDQWIKGMDISSLAEVERAGGKFYDHGVERNLIDILKEYGVNTVRLRLWNHPYTENGISYGGGGNDIETTLELAGRAMEKGMDWILVFHYSDFWADPGKQTIPKAWQGLDVAGLEQAVYAFTRQTLLQCRAQGRMPKIVTIGNELSNGLLWPYGRVPQYENIARFVDAGIRAVREVDAFLPVMVHLDNGGNEELYRTWFDAFLHNSREDFTYIGMSYYPFWHGTLDKLEANMKAVASRYHKKLVVTEVSMGHTLEDYQEYEKLPDRLRKGPAANAKTAAEVPYPMTPQGQADFVSDFLQVLNRVPQQMCEGFCYWEPAWLPVPGSEWASAQACIYMGEKGPGGNEWANQALFDYDGHVLPALSVIRDFQTG